MCFFWSHHKLFSLWPLRAGPSPMLSMCVSRLTSWYCRITRLFVARTGAISFWMRLRTSRISSPNDGSHCSTLTGKDEYRDSWETWYEVLAAWVSYIKDAYKVEILLIMLILIPSVFIARGACSWQELPCRIASWSCGPWCIFWCRMSSSLTENSRNGFLTL